MKVKTNPATGIISSLRSYFIGDTLAAKLTNEPPLLPSELFSADQMEEYGKFLAESHKLAEGRAPDQLLRRLADNEDVLKAVRTLMTEAVKANQRITPAGEWLLDNFYLIEEQIHTGKRHLPKGYSETLPRLANTSAAGLPRAYDIALTIISHSDGRIDSENLSRFVAAYQNVSELKLGELWAIPIMLRLALIENLRRVAARMANDRLNWSLAGHWADQMVNTAEKDPKSLILVIADMARSNPPMESAFVAELTRRLQGQGPALALPLTWMEQRLSESGLTSVSLVNAENQKQAADQISMSNCIGSLRYIGSMDWREFVETMSVVEQTLRAEPQGVYGKMDFQTRDRYRHVVEKIAKEAGVTENEVARKAVELAASHPVNNGSDNHRAHVGYYLVDEGLLQTKKACRLQESRRRRVTAWMSRQPLPFYLSAILLLSVLIGWIMLGLAGDDNISTNMLVLVGLLSLLCATYLAVAVVNWLSSLWVQPHLLPRMDFSPGIPSEDRTLVVVPVLLSDPKEIDELLEALEVRFLANRDENLHFGLLTDFTDAAHESLAGDEELVRKAKLGIESLNTKYGRETNDTFFLFHRPRRWNAQEKVWMGYERKRGKLTELNELLRGKSRDRFTMIVGEAAVYTKVRYVITLDADTQLPRDAAWKLIGIMAHPLNHPVFDMSKRRVVRGYGILQPRVAVSLPGPDSSLYAKMHSNDAGIDPYTRAVSDIYQDIFGEGSFIGKGIYEVDTFERALGHTLPENRILSHDLLEGCYVRSGLVSDVQLYEAYPPRYGMDVMRRHRWVRGDWQVGGWILPVVPGEGKKYHRNTLSGLSRWKIFDNIRRSLVGIALTILLVLAWTVLAGPVFLTLAVLAILLLPSLLPLTVEAFRKPEDISWRQHLRAVVKAGLKNLLYSLFNVMCLPFEAYSNLDAIIRTNWRMIVSGKGLLEWNPSASSGRRNKNTLVSYYRSMWISVALPVAVIIFLVQHRPMVLLVAFPVLALWLLAPAVAWYISKPRKKHEMALSLTQIEFLHKQARKTWAFFEKFVGDEDNWLPPDNYQEHPVAVVAHRTSPTNIGLSLLSGLTAYDFGYINLEQLLKRTTNTFSTMAKLEKFQGHLYNWYDTQTLKPLFPRYISTVDSGNLAGHLLTLRQGLLEILHAEMPIRQTFRGLYDTLLVFKGELSGNHKDLLRPFRQYLDQIIASGSCDPYRYRTHLEELVRLSDEIKSNADIAVDINTMRWAIALHGQISDALESLRSFMPWLFLPISETIQTWRPFADKPAISNIARMDIPALLEEFKTIYDGQDQSGRLHELEILFRQAASNAEAVVAKIADLAANCEEFSTIEYEFLYDRSRHLLSIGLNAEERRRDSGFYDLLASEARLGIFVAIAQGKLPQESWFALGRLLTNPDGSPILLSWSGSMFEYLMPEIVMPDYDQTLLAQSNKAAVDRQIKYGRKKDVPWGISESAYNTVDAALNYQYHAFGVPGLGLKRGLEDDLVIAPYATMLALMVSPEAACVNLEEMAAMGFVGDYGFFEAIDYTPSRVPAGQSYAVIRSFMAHHQGMSLLSLSSILLDRPMKKRFESDPRFQATILLLQERVPKSTAYYTHASDTAETAPQSEGMKMRVFKTASTPVPEVQLLSNGRYHVMVNNAGSGYSRWKDLAVTRWREDSTSDSLGAFCYIRDLDSGKNWSASYQPALKASRDYEVIFTQGRAEFRRRDENIETHLEIVVSPEDDTEIRRIHVKNRSRERRLVEITSYAEVVLANPVADAVHPAFSNLFVQTKILDRQHAILCTRRPRSAGEHAPWMFHLMKAHGAEVSEISYETSRMNFIGRTNSLAAAAALDHAGPLSGSDGSVLDPIVAIRYCIFIESHEETIIDMVYGIGDSQEICKGLIDKYQDRHLTDRAFELSWIHSQVVRRQINAAESDAQLYERLAGSVIYLNPLLRSDPGVLIRNYKGQSGLWGYAISGDLPIVLLRIQDATNIVLVKQMVQAHAYWRLKGLIVDLVIWNEDHSVYRQELQDQITALIAAGIGADMADRPGGIFVRSADQIPNEDRILLQTVARIVISDNKGTLAEQMSRRVAPKPPPDYMTQDLALKEGPIVIRVPDKELAFFNGVGGFAPDGKEYVITTYPGQATPLPWSNVIANPNFGTVISESGSAYTWAENAHELRLTPWLNDPVSDPGGEAYYIRDEETGQVWSPLPLPVKSKSSYSTRHGFGYSVFTHTENEIYSELTTFVDLEASIKFVALRLHNRSGRPRKLSVTGYVEWVLGDIRQKSLMHIITEADNATGVQFARNSYNNSFPGRIAFFYTDDAAANFTADRMEFIGRNGTLQSPDGMSRKLLSGKTGASLDSCSALRVQLTLDDDQQKEVTFRLGIARNRQEAMDMTKRFSGAAAAREALDKVNAYWNRTLSVVNVRTPDAALNFMANGWLLYQTLACRFWGRSGYYQSGGAFGFRDQLQDVMAVLHAEPGLARIHILLCASRQFKEGDVQHWWHPPTGKGVRTRCSDDYLWLPFVTSRYVLRTGDNAILNEQAPFLEGRLLNEHEESYYDMPIRSDQSASLYEHCVRAIRHGLRFGVNGLPLIGSGDWNDGMSMVGIQGKGESVWLAFFLFDVLNQFTAIALKLNDTAFAEECTTEAEKLRTNIEKNAWDGEWYRRAYFDDGTPLGSSESTECRIDSIAQSWSVLSGAGDKQRSLTAMESANKYLVKRDAELIQLLDPPFDKSETDPGYIKGYVPGVRENGGQYTHAAIWLVMGFAKLGDRKKAWELFRMINPVNHASGEEKMTIYKVEPYVVAADVYGVAPHIGRGGWTWYTGSAAWMYQLIIEALLGIKTEGDKLYIDPCLPEEWDSYEVDYRLRDTIYHIEIRQHKGEQAGFSLMLDNIAVQNPFITMIDDGQEHAVKLTISSVG